MSIVHSLPPNIAAELDAARKRTGDTDALRIAAQRLLALLALTPAQFERIAAELLKNKSNL